LKKRQSSPEQALAATFLDFYQRRSVGKLERGRDPGAMESFGVT
jgi:hypothetical protein